MNGKANWYLEPFFCVVRNLPLPLSGQGEGGSISSSFLLFWLSSPGHPSGNFANPPPFCVAAKRKFPVTQNHPFATEVQLKVRVSGRIRPEDSPRAALSIFNSAMQSPLK